MKTYLIRFSTYGIKNLERETTVDFYNDSIRKNSLINIQNKNIKAIFGMNGVGKTAYILSMEIYKNINLKSDYLLQDKTKKKLSKLINKTINKLYFECIFAVCEEDDQKVSAILKHTIKVNPKINELGQLVFGIEEELSKSIGMNINGKYKTIYINNNGKIKFEYSSLQHLDNITEKYGNKLEYSSLSSCGISILVQSINENNDYIFSDKDVYWYIIFTAIFGTSLKIYLDEEDLHDDFELGQLSLKIIKSKYYDFFKNYTISLNKNEDIVSSKNLDLYRRELNKLAKFIRIFKPDLVDIYDEEKYDGTNYHCRKIFKYKNYEVDEEYESSGIKRIIKLYYYLKNVCNGFIVFIDELDANISGVLLDKLIDFFVENGKGQLCFTSHDIFSMNTLKKYKNSITTFGQSGKVVNIIKNGHYSPANQFYDGMIEDSPFNIDSFDFYDAFNCED